MLSNLSLLLKKASKVYLFTTLFVIGLYFILAFTGRDPFNTQHFAVQVHSASLKYTQGDGASAGTSGVLKLTVTSGTNDVETTTYKDLEDLESNDVQHETPPEPTKSMNNNGQKLNVLFLVSDDLRPQLNSYTGKHNPNPYKNFKMHTPNLDNLARKSLQLNKAYVQFSVCSPSRSSYMTSRRPDTTKVWDLTSFWRDVGGNFTSIPEHFKHHGYRTAGFGKIYHPGVGHNDPLSWTEPYYYDANGLFYQVINDSWWAVPKELSKKMPLHDEDITDAAIELMEKFAPKARTGEEPFFLGVGFQKPHIPFVFPERYMEYYPIDEMELAQNSYLPKNFPKVAYFAIEGKEYQDIKKYNITGRYNETLPDLPSILTRRAYFSCVSFVDDMVGRLIKAVHDLQLQHNTIISFIGDHGFHLGENNIWGKHTNLEQSTHAPLMIHIPGITDEGIESNSLVEFVDLFPTLVDIAGLTPMPTCPQYSSDIRLCTDGLSMVPLLKNPNYELRTKAISQIPRYKSIGYTLKTERYRYVEWAKLNKTLLADDKCQYDILWETTEKLGRELYDHEVDPEENNNIIKSEAHIELINRFSRELREFVSPMYSIVSHCFMSQ